MAKINAINNKTEELTIDPVTGDSFVQYDIGGTGEFRTGVDDTDDSYRISQGSALGTNDTFVMTAAGERTMPKQPAFLVYPGSAGTNVTGAGTTFTIQYNTEVFDVNSDFNVGTYTFTAPVTGKYALDASVLLGGITIADDAYIQIVTSNNTFQNCDISPKDVKTSSGYVGFTLSVLADMDAADTAHVTITSSGEAGDTNDVYANTTEVIFCGHLAC